MRCTGININPLFKASGYNLDQKNPYAADLVSHDPEQLLADYARLQGETQGRRDA